MKNLFLTCAVLFLVFAFGCQESSITDPIQPIAEDQDTKVNNSDLFQDKPDVRNHNLIGLKYRLADPSSAAFYELSGKVKYETAIIRSTDDSRRFMVSVKLGISALMFNSGVTDHPIWKIEKNTVDNVLFTITGTPAKKLHKAYTITNRDDVKLVVTYLITSKSVKVLEVFLRAFNAAEDDDATN
ncbi:hypothetical protein ACFLSH_03005 [Bacteroidota bacterium]